MTKWKGTEELLLLLGCYMSEVPEAVAKTKAEPGSVANLKCEMCGRTPKDLGAWFPTDWGVLVLLIAHEKRYGMVTHRRGKALV